MYVIAGVTGHVGSAAAKELLAKKKPLMVIVRDAKKGEAWSKQGAQVAVGSLEDSAFLTQALNGADGFFVLTPPRFDVTDFFAYQEDRRQRRGGGEGREHAARRHALLYRR